VQLTPAGSRIYRFGLDRISNLRPGMQECMGALVLTLEGDRLVQEWTSLDQDGRPAGTIALHLRRL
jgi:hypothetical protein